MSGGINAIGNLLGKVDANNNLCVYVSGGSGTPGSPADSVQFNSAGSFAGSADLTFDDATDTLTLGGYVLDANTLSADYLTIQAPTGDSLYLTSNADVGSPGSALALDASGTVSLFGSGAMTIQSDATITLYHQMTADAAQPIGASTRVDSAGFDASGSILAHTFLPVAEGDSVIGHTVAVYMQPQVNDTSVVTSVYGGYFIPLAKAAGATLTNSYAYYSADLLAYGTNPYFLWYDGGPGGDANGAGVFRVNQFGILAYYNPAFTKYTPGLANFERELIRWGDTGVFGTDNVAYMGVEAGGTGTNRVLSLLGASVQAETVPGTFAFMKAKLQTSVNATTGLVAGVLAATTNASMVITDASGQAYRVPCII